jgi:uncharacterized protein YjbJ (UPF0337 family)
VCQQVSPLHTIAALADPLYIASGAAARAAVASIFAIVLIFPILLSGWARSNRVGRQTFRDPQPFEGHRFGEKDRGRNSLAHTPFARLEPAKEDPMDWNRVEGNWKQLKGKIKEQWGKLTDDDINVINGHREQLEGKIQERYGYGKDQIRKEIDAWYGRQTWQ